MWRASPVKTVSVTARSGCSEVPDFSPYFRTADQPLSMLSSEGPCMRPPILRGVQRRIDGGRIEAREPLVADEQHRQRQQTERHQLLARAGVTADVPLGERDALLR